MSQQHHFPNLTPEEEGHVVNVAMHAALFPRFADWLVTQNLGISPPMKFGDEAPGDPGWRIITVPDDLLRRLEQKALQGEPAARGVKGQHRPLIHDD